MVKTTFIGNNDHINTPTYITPWALIHALLGLTFSLLSLNFFKKHLVLTNFIVFIILHTIYECKDICITYLIDLPKKNKQYHNTLVNSIGDTIFAVFGWYIGYMIYLSKPRNYVISIIVVIYIITVIIFEFAPWLG